MPVKRGDAVSWEKELDEVARRRELAYRMGGAEKVERHHASGKLTVRERIDGLLDAGSFREIGTLAGAARYEGTQLVDFVPANQVVGHGTIDARRSLWSATTSRCAAVPPMQASTRSCCIRSA
jgi:acetyl-CoA carboxylase carboxyltransferase component